MNIAVLGTGIVGQTLGTRLVGLGHSVTMGSRSSSSEGAVAWLESLESDAGSLASVGTFAEAAVAGELIINATAGMVSLEVLSSAGASTLGNKPLLDLSNPLDFSQGFPPRLSVCNDDSVGEQIQRAFPEARVVKSLNTINCQVMADPARVPGHHVNFISGNDDDAKTAVRGVLTDFGWAEDQIVDLGDISAARATEMYLPLWLRLMNATGTPDFNIDVIR